MQIRAFHTLLTIAEVGSFAETAKRLNMTLSAVSMQMKVLEEELATNLFDRSQRPPVLTAKGFEIVNHARSIVRSEREIFKACAPDGVLRGTFRIGFVLSASVRLLPQFLKAASEHMPEAQFEVETNLSERLEEKIIRGQLDLAVLTLSEKNKAALDMAVLQTEPLVYAIPKSLAKRPIGWLLNNLTFLQFAPSSGIGRLISRHIGTLHDKPSRTIVLDGMESILECVKQGIGFTILPKPDIERYAGKALATRTVVPDELSRDLALVARRSHFTAHHWAQLKHLFAQGSSQGASNHVP